MPLQCICMCVYMHEPENAASNQCGLLELTLFSRENLAKPRLMVDCTSSSIPPLILRDKTSRFLKVTHPFAKPRKCKGKNREKKCKRFKERD